MTSRTPIYGIPYPDSTDKPKDASTHFSAIALGVEAALQTASIPAVVSAAVMVAPSAAARDAFWGTPSTAADQLTLQNRGATTIRSDTGWEERYFAAYNAATNPAGATPAGWYPVAGRMPWLRLDGGTAGGQNVPASSTSTILATSAYWGVPSCSKALNVAGSLYSNDLFSVDIASGQFRAQIPGHYRFASSHYVAGVGSAAGGVGFSLMRNKTTVDYTVDRILGVTQYRVTGFDVQQAMSADRDLTTSDILRIIAQNYTSSVQLFGSTVPGVTQLEMTYLSPTR